MSCIIKDDGKEVSEVDVANHIATVEGSLTAGKKSLHGESLDDLQSRTVEANKNRFVDVNLFTAEQQASYVKTIFHNVLDKLGVIIPGKEFEKSPNALFNSIREEFQHGADRFNELSEFCSTQEEVEAERADTSSNSLVHEYPELLTMNANQLKTLGKQWNDLAGAESFDKFTKLVVARLSADVGIQLVKSKFKEVGETQAERDEKNGAGNQQFDDGERVINASFEENQAFKMNPRNTATARVKAFLWTIPSGIKNKFGMADFIPMKVAFEKMLTMGSKLMDFSYDGLQAQLKIEGEKQPYLNYLSAKLKTIKDAGNYSLLHDFLTTINKSYAEHDMHTWMRSDEGIVSKIYGSNRNSVIKQIADKWLENQKGSSIVTRDALGNMSFDKNKVAELQTAFTSVKTGDFPQQKEFLKTFFSAIGIDFSDDMINDMKRQADAGEFDNYNNKIKSFDQLFADKVGIGAILKTYALEPKGKNDSTYNDVDNAMINEKTFNIFANIYYGRNPDEFQATSHRNGEGESIYSFINTSFIEDLKKKLSGSPDYIKEMVMNHFAKSSEALQKLDKSSPDYEPEYVFKLMYHDSFKEDRQGADAVTRAGSSDKEILVENTLKFQNSAGAVGISNAMTLSDKTASLDIHMTKYPTETTKDVAYIPGKESVAESFVIKDALKDQLLQLAQPEIDRMAAHANLNKDNKPNLKNFNQAQKLFYLFPILNGPTHESGEAVYPALRTIVDKIQSGTALKDLPAEDVQHLKDILGEAFKQQSVDSFHLWEKHGIFERTKTAGVDKDGLPVTKENYNFKWFNKDYIANFKKTNEGETGFNLAMHGVIDQKINNLRSQINLLQVAGMDPALFYKAPNGDHGKAMAAAMAHEYDTEGNITKQGNIQDAPWESKFKTLQSTWPEFSKRAALFIAPGSKGVWKWFNDRGESVEKNMITQVMLNTWKTDVGELFKGSDVTDAQEFITLQEHIDRLMSEGKIESPLWNKLNNRIKESLGKPFYTISDILSNDEKGLILQPTKPVMTGMTSKNGFSQVDYVKSSTFVLIPEIVAGMKGLDGLRLMMEHPDNLIGSAVFDTAKKVGQPMAGVDAFDKEGNFQDPHPDALQVATQTIARDGLRTQQEIPDQHDVVTNISQLNRNLFEGLLGVPDFHIDSDGGTHSFTGKEMKDLKENVRINLFNIAQKDIINRLGLQQQDGKFHFKDNEKLLNLLREEATAQKFSQNDLNALKLDDKGNFAFPLHFLPSGGKYEALLNAVISKSVQLTNPGASFVQTSGVGTKMDFSKLSASQKSAIIFTHLYDAEKGLQYMRKDENGNTRGAQVFVSQYMHDEKGNAVDISKYVTEVDGKKVLDPTKVPEKVLRMIGARIPNQNHSSDLPIEVAGFLPKYMQNTVIVPDGITSQMGSDFDVDKLYNYFSSLQTKYTDEGQKAIDAVKLKSKMLGDAPADPELLKEHQDNKKAYSDEINALQEQHHAGVAPVSYDLSGYDHTHQSLKDLNQEQLNELYKDIHWNVLTHEASFDKVTKPIDLPEVKQEAGKLDFLQSIDPNWSPMDNEYQMKVFNDNKGGKTGVAVFASLGAFLADNQDKGLYLKTSFQDKDTGEMIDKPNPVYIRNENGDLMPLVNISDPGHTYMTIAGKRELRTKSDNNNIALNESVDNTKNKMMAIFGWHPRVLSALGGFIALSTESGEIHDISFGTRLFLQDAIKSYVDQVEQRSDSLNENREQKVEQTVQAEIKQHYLNKLSAERVESLPTNPKTGEIIIDPKIYALSADTLLHMLKQSAGHETDSIAQMEQAVRDGSLSPQDHHDAVNALDDYYLNQINAMETFGRFDAAGKEIMKAGTATYVYTKGLGASVWDVADKLRKLQNFKESSSIGNLENMTGQLTNDESGELQLNAPKGEIGHSLKTNLFMARDIYKQMYPLHFDSGWFSDTIDKIFDLQGLDKTTMGSETFIGAHKKVFAGLKSYLFSKPDLGLFGDMEEERQHLLIDSDDNESLCTRVTAAIKEYPELATNAFLNGLKFNAATTPGEPSMISYKEPFSKDIDELGVTQAFDDLILPGNPVLMNIARDLVKYTMITGNEQTPTSFARFIPIDYFMTNEQFTGALQNLAKELPSNSEFIKQYIQNNPGRATKIESAARKEFIRTGNSGEFTVNVLKEESAKLLVAKSKQEQSSTDNKSLTKLPSYLSSFNATTKSYELYYKSDGLDGNTYKRINTLGTSKSGVAEYAYGKDNMESSIASNRTPNQSLDKALSNKDNPYHTLTRAEQINRISDVAMGDVATQYLGSNSATGPQANVNVNLTAWGDRANTGTYGPADKVMITGQQVEESHEDDTKNVSTEQLQSHFNKDYLPEIVKATNAEAVILVGNKSGIDQMTRTTLRQVGYLEQKSELGYSTFSRKADFSFGDNWGDEQPGYDDVPDGYFDNNPGADEDNAQSGAKASKALGKSISADSVDPVGDEPEASAEESAGANRAFTNAFKVNLDGAVPVASPSESYMPEDDDYEPSDADLMGSEEPAPVSLSALAKKGSPEAVKSTTETVQDYIPDAKGNNKLSDVLDNIQDKSGNGFYKDVIDILKKAGIPEINVITDNTAKDPGSFSNNTIRINPDLAIKDNPEISGAENIQNTVMHEVIHGFTANILEKFAKDPKSLSPEQRTFAVATRNLYNTARAAMEAHPEHGPELAKVDAAVKEDAATLSPADKSKYYGLTNVHEFASMLFTDHGFQKLMNDTQVDKSKTLSILDRFKEIMTNLWSKLSESTGIKIKSGSVLEHGINDIMSMVSAKENGGNDLVKVTPVKSFTRKQAQDDPKSLYLFTDNAGRTSGSNKIDDNSAYSQEHGTGKNYPGMTQAVIRGLDNALPITTMVDDKRTQWTDDKIEQYKPIIDKEIANIKEAMSSGKYDQVKFGGEMPFGKGKISDMKSSAPKTWDYLNDKLKEIGIDNTGKTPVELSDATTAENKDNAQLDLFKNQCN